MEESKPSWRERLGKLAGTPAAAPPITTKPAAKKFGGNMGALLRAAERGASGGVDRDGQSLSPSSEQRGVAGWLSSISPRKPGL